MKSVKRWGLPTAALIGVIGAIAVAGVPVAAGELGSVAPTVNFVAGNVTAHEGAEIQPWGAQWWKIEEVTGGSPASFKGYATSVDLATCTFTTRPGDSPPPPDPPQQGEMWIWVADSITKSGTTISGHISARAHVVLNGGYDDNPGHEVTGTVVELLSSCTATGSGGGDL
jgi:hypothetical protein